jgi:hypothetical protein
MNNVKYMTNGSTLLIENEELFTAISRLNYSFYRNADEVLQSLKNNEDVQCIVGQGGIPFGQSQTPSLYDFADGIDTVQFLLSV